MNHLWKFHKDALAIGLGTFFVYVGILHFTDVEWFTPIVPEVLPFSAEFWVILSGIPEILCGVGLIVPQTRVLAGKATVVLLSSFIGLISTCGSTTYHWRETPSHCGHTSFALLHNLV